MPINPVLLFTDHIEAFEKELLYPISREKLMNKNNRCFSIGSLTIILSCDDPRSVQPFEAYFNFDQNIRRNTSVVLITINTVPVANLQKEQFIWLQNRQGVLKGHDQYNSTIYQYEDLTFIKSYDGHYLQLFTSSLDQLVEGMPIVAKVIEGLVIDQYTGLGYLPVHSSLVASDQEAYLILGASQSGKTTFANKLQAEQFEVLSDDITFVGINDVVGMGHYIKRYSLKEQNGTVEHFQGTYREVVKISRPASIVQINKIFYMELSTMDFREEEILDKQDKLQRMIAYLHLFPNEYFISRQISYTLLIEISKRLANISTLLVTNKYLS